MANTLNVADITKNEQLNLTSEVSFTYGVNSPYPEEAQAPVPSANFTVGGDAVENLYRMDNVARIEHHRPNTSIRERVFGGRFSTSSDSNIGQMSVSHASNELNKDIRTWPIVRPRIGADTSNGRRVLVGALRHWYSECNLTEFGVRGDFLFSTSNYDPTVAFYDHPTMRFIPEYHTNEKVMVWRRIEPVAADSGASFEVGEKVTMSMKLNDSYGKPVDGEVTPSMSTAHAWFYFASGKVIPDGDDNVNTVASIFLQYNYSERRLYIIQVNENNQGQHTQWVYDNVPGFEGTPKFINVTMSRISDTRIEFFVQFMHRQGNTEFTYNSDVNLLPNALALTRVEATTVVPDTATTNLNHEGVQGMYIVKGDTFSVVEEDSWEISMPYFNKPKWNGIAVPAMQGNAWSMINELCTVYGLEFNPIHNTFTLSEDTGKNQPLPTGEGSNVQVQASTREIAETVELYNYNYVVPAQNNYVAVWKADRVFTVALGERIEEVIQLPEGTSLIDITQPICRSVQTVINWWNLPETANSGSVYSVYDDDNLEVDPASWNDSGGYVSLEHTPNPNEIKITIQAPNNDLISKKSNFHLSIAGSDIPSLLIAASGMKANKEKISIRTGAGKARNLKRVGTEYDSPLVGRTSLAYDVGAKLAALHGTTMTKASGTFPPIQNHDFPAFPLIKRGSYYRPINISDTPRAFNVGEAVRFNPVEWVQDNYQGITCGEYDTKWQGSICREVNISPLGKTHF